MVEDDLADGWFPQSVAADYDAPGGVNAPEAVVPVVDVLEDLADGGPVLEFAVGTGRIAAPLAARGAAVSGIELSRAMAARITGKPGGDKVEVTIGDMTTTRVAGRFSLAYLVFNTISNVTTQDGQVDVFRNAAAHLRPGGLFLGDVMRHPVQVRHDKFHGAFRRLQGHADAPEAAEDFTLAPGTVLFPVPGNAPGTSAPEPFGEEFVPVTALRSAMA